VDGAKLDVEGLAAVWANSFLDLERKNNNCVERLGFGLMGYDTLA
jgi:hypothetical protein